MCSSCHQKRKCVNFALLFCRGRHGIVRKCVLHVQHVYFPHSTNHILKLWCCHCPSPSSLPKLNFFLRRRRYLRSKPLILRLEASKTRFFSPFFSNKRWAVCPEGYFMQGMYRNDGQWLHHIEESRCCKPKNLPNSYLHCYNADSVGLSFDKKGWSSCAAGYYMAGFYKGGCDRLYCIESFKCCSMQNECKMANWWAGFDRKGWVDCDSSKHYITGLWRNTNLGSKDEIDLLEEAKCCPAPSPHQNTPSTCRTANWWITLDR